MQRQVSAFEAYLLSREDRDTNMGEQKQNKALNFIHLFEINYLSLTQCLKSLLSLFSEW